MLHEAHYYKHLAKIQMWNKEFLTGFLSFFVTSAGNLAITLAERQTHTILTLPSVIRNIKVLHSAANNFRRNTAICTTNW